MSLPPLHEQNKSVVFGGRAVIDVTLPAVVPPTVRYKIATSHGGLAHGSYASHDLIAARSRREDEPLASHVPPGGCGLPEARPPQKASCQHLVGPVSEGLHVGVGAAVLPEPVGRHPVALPHGRQHPGGGAGDSAVLLGAADVHRRGVDEWVEGVRCGVLRQIGCCPLFGLLSSTDWNRRFVRGVVRGRRGSRMARWFCSIGAHDDLRSHTQIPQTREKGCCPAL